MTLRNTNTFLSRCLRAAAVHAMVAMARGGWGHGAGRGGAWDGARVQRTHAGEGHGRRRRRAAGEGRGGCTGRGHMRWWRKEMSLSSRETVKHLRCSGACLLGLVAAQVRERTVRTDMLGRMPSPENFRCSYS
jgi:hypothetical protein